MVYAATMAALGYSSPGAPGSAQEAAWKRKHLVKALGVPVVRTLWVHRSTVESFNALNLVLQHHGARLGEKQNDWGFANRDIRNAPGKDSYHRYAKAEDLDPDENPQHTSQTSFPVNVTDEACGLLKLTWGLHFNAPWKDPMHFEDHLSRLRRRYIASRLVKPTKRSRRLARMAGLEVADFCRRVKKMERYPQ